MEKASEQEEKKTKSGTIEGESLLLPLLQGLLDAPESEQPADSGTESGEDLRSSLIFEVQSALDKLSASLRSDSTDVTPERRSSLLQLVTKLQAGLATSIKPTSERRNSSGRFARRRPRQSRHTVGVSSEELADARRLMEQIAFRDSGNITPSTSTSRITPSTSASQCSILQKQNSESSVGQKSPSIFKPVKISHQKMPVKNAIAKPFSNSTSGTSSSVETPTDPSEALHFLFANNDEPKRSPSLADLVYTETAQVELRPKKPNQPYRQSFSLDHNEHPNTRPPSEVEIPDQQEIKSAYKAVQQAAAVKRLSSRNVSESTQDDSESDEEETNTVKTPQHTSLPEPIPSPNYYQPTQPQPDLILQANPIYNRPQAEQENNPEEKYNRFISKKMRMKRANTIDIPKPLNFYECDDEDDESEEQYDDNRRNSYLALRGPIHVGKLNANNKVPTFQPKTDSDKKFVAFLNKHNENNANKTAFWTNKVHNWNNKFGNIRTNFEKVSQPEKNVHTAQNFWKSADDAVTAGSVTHQGPKISRQSARNLQQMFEEKQKQQNGQSKVPWMDSKDVITGSLKVDTKGLENRSYKFVQHQQPQSPVNKFAQVQPQSPVNKFSHAPMSAFKPIPKKIPPPEAVIEPITKPDTLNITKDTIVCNSSDTPLYLYCPKPLYSPSDSQSSSPVTPSKSFLQPEKKAVNLAASKFEQAAKESNQFHPKNLNRHSVHGSLRQQPIQQPAPVENLTAPYLVRSAEQKSSNLVRKLSDQFNSSSKNEPPPQPAPQFSSVSSVKYNVTPQQSFKTPQSPKTAAPQKPHNYIPPIQPLTPRKTSQPNAHQHHYTPQYNRNPQQFIQPLSPTKPEVRKAKVQEREQDNQQFTSNYVYQPQKTQQAPKPVQNNLHRQRSLESSLQNSTVAQRSQAFKESPKTEQPQFDYQRQDSQGSYKEYNAAVTRVMKGPVSQQAVTVRQKSPMNRDEHEMERAFNLRSVLQKSTQRNTLSSGSFKTPYEQARASRTPSPNVQNFRSEPKTPPNFSINGKQVPTESLEVNDEGAVTGKFHIPIVNIEPGTPTQVPTQAQVLSKSDSWHQICKQSQPPQHKPSPVASPNSKPVKSKSSHTLAVPKLYEAGMSKDEMAQKRRTMEAFFAVEGKKSPTSETKESPQRKTSINRIKTSQKISVHKQATIGISRSRTLPDIVCPEMLDESNIDKAFEDLFKQSS